MPALHLVIHRFADIMEKSADAHDRQIRSDLF